MSDLLLRQEANALSERLFMAMLSCIDDARYERLTRMRWRAEQRYWRRHERAYPPGNRTPEWFYKTADAGY